MTTNDICPDHSVLYRAGPTARQLAAKGLPKVFQEETIEPAPTEWAIPVNCAPKKDGRFILCVDYCRLSEMTIKYSYPISRMKHCINVFEEAGMSSPLDLNSRYWQVEIDKRDISKGAFTSGHGHFQSLQRTSGLENAPATFQQSRDIV